MDFTAQFRVMNPHQLPFLNRHRKPDYYSAISKINTRILNQRHIPKLKCIVINVLFLKAKEFSISDPLNDCSNQHYLLQVFDSDTKCLYLYEGFCSTIYNCIQLLTYPCNVQT